jgi:hypothetical protein
MLMWSNRRTQLHTSGREAGETRLGTKGRLFAAESTSGVAGSVLPLPQETSANARKSPIKWEKTRFILLLISTV